MATDRASSRREADDLDALELRLLLEGIHARYGYDFRAYAPDSMRRRLAARMAEESVRTFSALQEKVLHDPDCFERLLLALTVHVTSMFRDPDFFLAFRQVAVPWLETWPFLRLWVAGCSTGEEVYSLAIVLEEEGLLERSRIYATDLSDTVLARARKGVFPLGAMQEHTANYQAAGGKGAFSSYYSADHDRALMAESLRRHTVFAQHNLVTDGSPNEFHAILCRNVLIYFDEPLQHRVHTLFHDSLIRLGFLGLGQGETLRFTPHAGSYAAAAGSRSLFQKVKPDEP